MEIEKLKNLHRQAMRTPIFLEDLEYYKLQELLLFSVRHLSKLQKEIKTFEGLPEWEGINLYTETVKGLHIQKEKALQHLIKTYLSGEPIGNQEDRKMNFLLMHAPTYLEPLKQVDKEFEKNVIVQLCAKHEIELPNDLIKDVISWGYSQATGKIPYGSNPLERLKENLKAINRDSEKYIYLKALENHKPEEKGLKASSEWMFDSTEFYEFVHNQIKKYRAHYEAETGKQKVLLRLKSTLQSVTQPKPIRWLKKGESLRQFLDKIKSAGLIEKRETDGIILEHFIVDGELPTKNPKPLIWIESLSLLAYMIESLDSEYIKPDNLWSDTVSHFSKNGQTPQNMRQTANRYKNNKSGKPKDYQIIDEILEELLG